MSRLRYTIGELKKLASRRFKNIEYKQLPLLTENEKNRNHSDSFCYENDANRRAEATFDKVKAEMDSESRKKEIAAIFLKSSGALIGIALVGPSGAFYGGVIGGIVTDVAFRKTDVDLNYYTELEKFLKQGKITEEEATALVKKMWKDGRFGLCFNMPMFPDMGEVICTSYSNIPIGLLCGISTLGKFRGDQALPENSGRFTSWEETTEEETSWG